LKKVLYHISFLWFFLFDQCVEIISVIEKNSFRVSEGTHTNPAGNIEDQLNEPLQDTASNSHGISMNLSFFCQGGYIRFGKEHLLGYQI